MHTHTGTHTHIRTHIHAADIKGQLLSLSSELLPLFLELVRQLVDNPSAHTAQLSAVNDSMEAMQHLSNLLRHQQVLFVSLLCP